MTALPPDPWGLAPLVATLRAEVLELRAEVQRLRDGQVDPPDPYVDNAGAAALLGRSAASFKRLRQRSAGRLDRFSEGAGKDKRWRRSVVLGPVAALIAAGVATVAATTGNGAAQHDEGAMGRTS